MVLSGGQSITQYVAHVTIPHVMLAVYASSFLGLKILQSCQAAPAHQYLFFNCWLEWTRPQYFQATTASREWSTFLADLSCRIFISGSLSTNTHAAHDFTETLNMFQLQKEWKIWEKTGKADKIKCIWQIYMYPGVRSLSLNQWELILKYKSNIYLCDEDVFMFFHYIISAFQK